MGQTLTGANVMMIPSNVQPTHAVNRYNTPASGAIRRDAFGARIGCQNAAPKISSEIVCSARMPGLLVAALHKVGSCQNHIAPTPASQHENTFSPCNLVETFPTRFGHAINNNGGTASSNKRCCNMCALNK